MGSARDEIEFSKSVSGLEADIIGGMFRKPCESLGDELKLTVCCGN
jgi:hypothetical protein